MTTKPFPKLNYLHFELRNPIFPCLKFSNLWTHPDYANYNITDCTSNKKTGRDESLGMICKAKTTTERKEENEGKNGLDIFKYHKLP